MQGESVTTALLTDTVLSVVHSLYGKEGSKKYKSQPQVFLPGYEPPEVEETEGVFHNLSDQTIEIFMAEHGANRIPQFALIHLAESIPSWSQKNDHK
jgi:hypothetical protein